MSLGRHRNYAESRTFSEAAFGAAPLVPWVAADVLDPPWMGSALSGHVNINHTGRVKPIDHTSAHVPGLYSLDGLAYESIMLGSFRIFRCKKHYAGCDEMYYKNGTLKSPEWADNLLGFSRDGFSWSRTPIAQPVGGQGFELTPSRRYPFVGQALGTAAWNSQGLDGWATGGLTIVGPDRQHESLRVFICSVSPGVAILRRDGFSSLGAADPRLATTITTVALVFKTAKTALFLNLDGGLAELAVLDAGGDAVSAPLLTGTPLPRSTNSTMVEVELKAGAASGLSALRGKPFRLAITLEPRARLYSFWLSEGSDGHSGGYLGAGSTLYPHGLRDDGRAVPAKAN